MPFTPVRKPPPGTKVNWGHSLGTGLSICFPMNEGGGGQVIDIVGGVVGAFSGSTLPVWRNEIDGPAVHFSHGAAATTFIDCGTPTSAQDVARLNSSGGPVGSSWFIRFLWDDVSNANGGLCERNDNNSVNAGWFIGFDNSAGSPICALQEFSVANQRDDFFVPVVNTWYDLIVTKDQSAANTKFTAYLNGVQQTSTTQGTGSGTSGSDATQHLFIGRESFQSASCWAGLISTFCIWKGRILTLADAQLLHKDPWAYMQQRPSPRVYFIPQVVVAPSQDWQFYDSYPYRRSRDVQQAFPRNYIADASFAFQIPVVVQKTDWIYRDVYDYKQKPLGLARFQRDYIADASFVAAITFPVPHSDFIFYDSENYNARQARVRQAAFDRNQTLNVFQATVPPSFDWHFYDFFDYRALPNRLARIDRNAIADASFMFTASGAAPAPHFDYDFYDSFNYNYAKFRALKFARDYSADSAAVFAPTTAVVPPQDYIFYDSTDYNKIIRLIRDRAFDRNYIASAPPQIAVAFVNPASWEPVITPVSIPVRQRQSDVFYGFPNDIRDGTLLPGWDFILIGDSWRNPRLLREQYRWWYQQVQPYKPEKTFLSAAFFATMQPWNATLTKSANRNFFAVMNAWAATLSILTPKPPAIVGAALGVCKDLRNVIAIKLFSATVCEDPRVVTVPANTAALCKSFIKDPQATTDYSIDWTLPLQNSGDTIATSVWTTDPGIAVAKSSWVGFIATAFISGGVVGTSYSVTNTITTTGGRTLAQNFILQIKLR